MPQKQVHYLLATIAALVISGCAGTPEQVKKFEPPVYPPPPAEPRFIFERTLLYSDDVEEFTSGMRFRQFATGSSRKLKGLIKPFDVAVYQGRVYVTDTVQRAVLLYDIPGKRFVEIGTEKPGELIKPLGIDISKNGELYVCDISAQRIMVYDLEGKYLRAVGNKEILSRPSDVAINPDGTRLYVIDTGGVDVESHHIMVFDPVTGDHLQTIGKRGNADGEFNLPLQITVGPDGMLYVVDGGNFRVQAFHPDGSFAFAFGSAGRLSGQFARPKGIATDKEGNIYVVDTAFGNFQIFDKEGQLLMFIGERGNAGTPGKYSLPAGIDVDENGRIFIVDQFFRKIDIFRPFTLPAGEGYAVPSPAPAS